MFDFTFVSMQAQNVALVDKLLEEMEDELLAEYLQDGKPAMDRMMLVSAISQM